MKRILSAGVLAALFAGVVLLTTPLPLTAQDAAQKRWTDSDLAQLIADIQTQQTQIKANQDKLDASLAAAQEAVRQARIYAARGGKN